MAITHWNPNLHPRGPDGKFIPKGTYAFPTKRRLPRTQGVLRGIPRGAAYGAINVAGSKGGRGAYQGLAKYWGDPANIGKEATPAFQAGMGKATLNGLGRGLGAGFVEGALTGAVGGGAQGLLEGHGRARWQAARRRDEERALAGQTFERAVAKGAAAGAIKGGIAGSGLAGVAGLIPPPGQTARKALPPPGAGRPAGSRTSTGKIPGGGARSPIPGGRKAIGPGGVRRAIGGVGKRAIGGARGKGAKKIPYGAIVGAGLGGAAGGIRAGVDHKKTMRKMRRNMAKADN